MEEGLKIKGRNGRNRDALPIGNNAYGFERARSLVVTKDQKDYQRRLETLKVRRCPLPVQDLVRLVVGPCPS